MSLWNKVLPASETIIWAGQPEWGLTLNKELLGSIGIGVLVVLFGAVQNTNEDPFANIIMALGLAAILASIMHDGMRRLFTRYALSEQHVFEKTWFLGWRYRLAPIRMIALLEIGSETNPTLEFSLSEPFDALGRKRVTAVRFYRVRDGKEIFERLLSLQKALS